jgi:hypothetical protein
MAARSLAISAAKALGASSLSSARITALSTAMHHAAFAAALFHPEGQEAGITLTPATAPSAVAGGAAT